MLLQFFGTKGYVEESSRGHSGHSAFVLEEAGFRLLCDFGQNRKGMLVEDPPRRHFPLARASRPRLGARGGDRRPGLRVGDHARDPGEAADPESGRARRRKRSADLGPFRLTAFPVLHSVRCPGIAARIAIPGFTLVYSGDIVAFEDPDAALSGADLYIGDGSTLTGSLVRRHPSGALIGHTTVRAQLGWLARHGIPRAIFSHFGKQPIEHGRCTAARRPWPSSATSPPPGCAVTAATTGWSSRSGSRAGRRAALAAPAAGKPRHATSARHPRVRRQRGTGRRHGRGFGDVRLGRLRGRRGGPRPDRLTNARKPRPSGRRSRPTPGR